MVDKPISARELLLWQPDPEVAGSTTYPFHAVRIVNTTGFVLQRGPIKIVQDGRVVVRAVIRRLGIGETIWIAASSIVTRASPVFRSSRRIPRGWSGARAESSSSRMG